MRPVLLLLAVLLAACDSSTEPALPPVVVGSYALASVDGLAYGVERVLEAEGRVHFTEGEWADTQRVRTASGWGPLTTDHGTYEQEGDTLVLRSARHGYALGATPRGDRLTIHGGALTTHWRRLP